ncbi:winged helix-turn-helix transcriptional regulator [Nocardioides xinjiangensis]|uniref:winged helix-turn-helix transcriptional regulator n=1 Tax=Nocardioides xinjiangensis TaxID=2817376 RepID=UPI001B30787F|nr:helix-turn-helix domain-containing protein [Nocardioides sp. SYSU D00514]
MSLDTSQWNPYDRNCPSRRLLDRIGDRWTVLIIGALSDGPHRFKAITERVDGISQKMLTQTLRGLERDGLVKRTVYPVVPPRVEYELTAAGRSLCEPLAALEEWAREHMSGVLAARATYDATTVGADA